MRLIDADRLKEKVLKWLPGDPCGIEEKEHPIETDIVVSLMMEIEEAPTVGEWIPVNEKLPKKSGWYLVTIRGYKTVTDVSLYSADGSAWGDVSTKQKVIAWMPRPEPYREDGEEYELAEYELATEQMEHDAMYEPTYNPEDGNM